MSETHNGRKVFSLLELTRSIQRMFAQNYNRPYWIKAEMIKLNHYPHSGHCYPDLVDKQDGKVVAEMRAQLWRSNYARANAEFLKVTKEPLKDGIKILFLAQVSFSPKYGLALNILEIDPNYTLGDLEKEKQLTILRLQKEGIFGKNKTLKLPLLPQRIAVISVETSKGYSDFLSIIDGNPWKYAFFHMLFPALLQGDNAIKSILGQLKTIRKVLHHFDAVTLIRGGGGDVGLSCYNDYRLASEIANFPIPVITGIGHSTNETVSEMVAWYNAITPTKLGEFLMQKFHDFSMPVQNAQGTVIRESKQLLALETDKMNSITRTFLLATRLSLGEHQSQINHLSRNLGTIIGNRMREERQRISRFALVLEKDTERVFENEIQWLVQIKSDIERNTKRLLEIEKYKLELLEKSTINLDPANVLKRGFSITRFKGKAVKTTDEIEAGDILETRIYNGRIESEVKSKTKENE